VHVPAKGILPLQFSQWPGYGLDEIFQLVALYPRLVSGGVLTFIPSDARSLFLPADIEYATKGSTRSEIVYL
jgi:hypothetical protein